MPKSTHRVICNRTFIQNRDIKLGTVNYLPLGAKVSVIDIDKEWAKIILPENNDYKYAYIPIKHLIRNDTKIYNWVNIAEKLIGTPYVWGGRNSMGLDCSALLQLSYQTYGENIPRNSNDQAMINKEVIDNYNFLERGFVVFWNGHVAIMTDELNCIHANAYHMEVSEPLEKIAEKAHKKTNYKNNEF